MLYVDYIMESKHINIIITLSKYTFFNIIQYNNILYTIL